MSNANSHTVHSNASAATTAKPSTKSQAKVVISTDKESLASNGLATVSFSFDSKPLGFTLDDVKVTNGILTSLVQAPLNPNLYTALFFGGITDRSGMSTIQLVGPYSNQDGLNGTPSNTITIKNVPQSATPTVGFASNNMSIVEGDNGNKLATFEIVLSSAINTEVVVSFSTDAKKFGTAAAGSDFISQTGTVTFAPGETKKTVTVEIVGDSVHEKNEYFYLDITSAKGATIVTNGAEGSRNSWVMATIKNDDVSAVPTIGFAKNNASIVEGNEGKRFFQVAVTLSSASTQQVSLDYTTQKKNGSATSGVDFLSSVGTLTFAPGETSKLISVEILGDKIYEANEYFYIDLIGAKGAAVVTDGAEGSRNSWVMATIQNDDANGRPTVGFAKNNQSIVEGNAGTKTMQFTATLSAPAKETVSVEYSTQKNVAGTAKAFLDYVPTTGTITFNAGETSKTISVEVVGDTTYEANEYFYLDLIKAVGADIVVNGAEGNRNSWVMATISNDDPANALIQFGGIVGTAGNDKIGGSAHDELIDGRGGVDILTGFAGNDTFVFAQAYASKSLQNAARVMDFKDGFDLIGLKGGFNFVDLVVSETTEGTLLSLANGDALAVLVGVQASTISASDFTLA